MQVVLHLQRTKRRLYAPPLENLVFDFGVFFVSKSIIVGRVVLWFLHIINWVYLGIVEGDFRPGVSLQAMLRHGC